MMSSVNNSQSTHSPSTRFLEAEPNDVVRNASPEIPRIIIDNPSSHPQNNISLFPLHDSTHQQESAEETHPERNTVETRGEYHDAALSRQLPYYLRRFWNWKLQEFLLEVAPIVVLFIISHVIDERVTPYERPLEEYPDIFYISHPLPVNGERVKTPLLIFLSWGVPAITALLFSIVRFDAMILYSVILGLFECYTITHTITTFGKKVAGSLRPNFLALCEWDGIECHADRRETLSARQSFPSGHASNAAGGLFFMMHFLAIQVPILGPRLPKSLIHIIAMLPVLMAFWIAITRTQDYYHRFEDIVAGLCIGGGTATAIFQSIFDSKSKTDTSQPDR